MSNNDIMDHLRREADNWIERQRAEEAMRQAKHDRHARNAQMAELWAQAIFAVACIAAAVWVVQVVSR